MHNQSDQDLIQQTGDRTAALLETLHRDLLELQRRASLSDPLKVNTAEQAEMGLRLYRAAIDAAMRVAENLAPASGR